MSRDGDALFLELYAEYADRLYTYCVRLTRSDEDAADVLQETFVNVYERLHRTDRATIQHPRAYLYAAARNACLSRIEDRRHLDADADVPEAPPAGQLPEPERDVLIADVRTEVRAAGEDLPERQREVLALREVEGMTYADIAALMGLTENAVAQLAWRARVGLRASLRHRALRSVRARTDDCDRALTLIELRDDRPLERADDEWLQEHLDACWSCRANRAAMLEAGASYRSVLPPLGAPIACKFGGFFGGAAGAGAAAAGEDVVHGEPSGAGDASGAVAVGHEQEPSGAASMGRGDGPSRMLPLLTAALAALVVTAAGLIAAAGGAGGAGEGAGGAGGGAGAVAGGGSGGAGPSVVFASASTGSLGASPGGADSGAPAAARAAAGEAFAGGPTLAPTPGGGGGAGDGDGAAGGAGADSPGGDGNGASGDGGNDSSGGGGGTPVAIRIPSTSPSNGPGSGGGGGGGSAVGGGDGSRDTTTPAPPPSRPPDAPFPPAVPATVPPAPVTPPAASPAPTTGGTPPVTAPPATGGGPGAGEDDDEDDDSDDDDDDGHNHGNGLGKGHLKGRGHGHHKG